MPKPGYCSDCHCTCMALDLAVITDDNRSEFHNFSEDTMQASCRKCNTLFPVYTPAQADEIERDLFG